MHTSFGTTFSQLAVYSLSYAFDSPDWYFPLRTPDSAYYCGLSLAPLWGLKRAEAFNWDIIIEPIVRIRSISEDIHPNLISFLQFSWQPVTDEIKCDVGSRIILHGNRLTSNATTRNRSQSSIAIFNSVLPAALSAPFDLLAKVYGGCHDEGIRRIWVAWDRSAAFGPNF